MHLLAPCTQTSPTQICIRLAPVVFLYLGWLCIQCKLYIKYIYIYNYIYIYKIHLNILNISAVIYISSIYTAFMLLPCCRLYNCLYALSHVHDADCLADNNHESSHTIPHHSTFASEQNAPSLNSKFTHRICQLKQLQNTANL